MGVRISRPLCSNPRVLRHADAEFDLHFVVVADIL